MHGAVDRLIVAVPFLALLAGCLSQGPLVQQCPAIAPELECPDWPTVAPPEALQSLQKAYLRGESAHASCAAVVDVWRTTWEECGGE